MTTANGQPILEAEITLPRVSEWRATLETDSDVPLSGAVTIEIDGVAFIGTVVPGRSGLDGGTARARVVGGRGGLSKQLPAKNYTANVRASTVLADLLLESGEVLSSTVDAALLGTTLGRWERLQGTAKAGIQVLADHLGAVWRVLPDGSIWVGVDTYPDVSTEHVLEDEDWTAGILTIAPEAPDLVPGVTFLGMTVDLVVHRVHNRELHTEVFQRSPRTALDDFLARIRTGVDYSRIYRARVVRKNSDGTLQLDPDNPKVKGAGVDHVRMTGAPLFDPDPGDIVRLGFEGGDPSKPVALAPDFAGEYPVARIGDHVDVYLTAAEFNGFLDGVPLFGVMVPLSVCVGVIANGNRKLKG